MADGARATRHTLFSANMEKELDGWENRKSCAIQGDWICPKCNEHHSARWVVCPEHPTILRPQPAPVEEKQLVPSMGRFFHNIARHLHSTTGRRKEGSSPKEKHGPAPSMPSRERPTKRFDSPFPRFEMPFKMNARQMLQLLAMVLLLSQTFLVAPLVLDMLYEGQHARMRITALYSTARNFTKLRSTAQNSKAQTPGLKPHPHARTKQSKKNDNVTAKNGLQEADPAKANYGFQAKSEMAPLCNVLRKKDVDFTLVFQISFSRLWIFKHHCQRWGAHPMSIAVWMENATAVGSVQFAASTHLGVDTYARLVRVKLEIMGCNIDMIAVSVITSLSAVEEYPVNRLRNLALSKVNTSHSITMDADFVVSADLYQNLLVHRAILAKDNKIALVIPAFEIKQSQCRPTDSAKCRRFHMKLVPLSKNGTLTFKPFQWKINRHGHSSTRSETWFGQDFNSLVPIKCVLSERYEPYLVVRYCRDTPPFQEAFTGYGQNKISWVQHMRHLGHKLFRVGAGFCAHVPHKVSPAKRKWRLSRGGRKKREVTNIAKAFKMWLKETIPRGFEGTPRCSKKQSLKWMQRSNLNKYWWDLNAEIEKNKKQIEIFGV
jgi:hypothetical protein